MPQNALVASYDWIEMGVGGSFSLPTDIYGIGDFGAQYQGLYAPDVDDLFAELTIAIGASSDSGGSWFATYDGPNAPFGGFGLSGTGPPPSDLSCYARFLNVKIYARYSSADLLTVWSGIEIRINGALLTTLGGGSLNSYGMGPQYVRIHTGLAYVGGGAGVNLNEAALTRDFSNSDGSYDISRSESSGGTIVGGYRYSVGGVVYDLPVQAPPASAEPPTSGPGHNGPGGVGGTVSAPFGLALPDVIAATRTWGSQIVSLATYDYHGTKGTGDFPYTTYRDQSNKGGALYIIPNTPRAIHRINDDFLASVWHWGTPQVTGIAARNISRYDTSPPDSTQPSLTSILYAHQSPGAEELGSAAGYADSLCAAPAYLCVSASQSRTVYDRGSDGSTGYTRDKGEDVTYRLPDLDDDASVGRGSTPYMQHASPLVRYFASSIVHPFWSLGYVPGDWNLGGSPRRWADDPDDPTAKGYWGYVREQFLAGQQRRNHVVSCPLEVDGWQQFLDAYNSNGAQTSGIRWLGISRWLTQEVVPPASLATDATGSAAWSSPDSSCALAFGSSGVTITGAAGASCRVRLDVGRFDCHPYLYPMVCDRVALGWETSGVDSFKAFAMTSFGDRAEFTPLSNGTAMRLPLGKSSKYAGSWGYDDGLGLVSDGGTDVKAGGVSPGLCGDSENSFMFRLLEARSPGLIEFDVQLSAGATTATIHWPVWYRAEGTRHLEAENGCVQSLVYADGPGVRVGNQVFYIEGVGLVNPPAIEGLGYKQTVVDWLCLKRLLLLAKAFDDGLATELTQLYDPYEVQSTEASTFGSLWFVLPSPGPEVRAAVVNAIGEIPPLAAHPSYSRKADWSRNAWGDAGVWAWAQGPRRIVAAGTTPMHLYKPDGATQVTSATSLGPSGWTITEHSTTVDNSESPNWQLKTGSDLWARVTPWHGWLWVGNVAAKILTRWLAQSKRGQLHLATSDGNQARYQKAKTSTSANGYYVDATPITTGDVLAAKPMIDESRRTVCLAVERKNGSSQDFWWYESTSDGRDADGGVLVAANAFGTYGWYERSGARGRTWFAYDSGTSGAGTQKGQRTIAASGAPFGPTFTFLDDSGNPIHIADGGWCNVGEAYDGKRRLTWSPTIQGESAFSEWNSIDGGMTWKRVPTP